ncbi:hypothetical protein Back11_39890 [Paenibacillus baekrokdamisoli]|uniref:Uncharacterized protein n=1 Tax=Paenibacillus baekrokdamisoli TaxID=1712516 RepID=A0A3G9JHY6_9BACL|nr:hypothetical protein [Paenibacillus baekrokdamisoli]MBB3068314.1 hypothetical protein [Paenibacillus baekrokdamisoli]BBH22644.1 hypothetical protein Back11_39890 [Paenibacillus baekrokdamisoli]
MKKLKFIIPGFLILAVIGGIVINLLLHVTVSADNIVVKDIKVSDGVLSLTGDFSDSALDYKGFNIRFEGDKLYIMIKGSLLSFGQKDSSFQFTLDSKEHGKITEVFLQDSSHTRKIWPAA